MFPRKLAAFRLPMVVCRTVGDDTTEGTMQSVVVSRPMKMLPVFRGKKIVAYVEAETPKRRRRRRSARGTGKVGRPARKAGQAHNPRP